MTTALEGGEWSAARPGRTLPPGKTRYPLYRRLGGPQGWSGRAENLALQEFDPRTVQPVVSRSTDWDTRPTFLFQSRNNYFVTWWYLLTSVITYDNAHKPHRNSLRRWWRYQDLPQTAQCSVEPSAEPSLGLLGRCYRELLRRQYSETLKNTRRSYTECTAQWNKAHGHHD